MGAVVSIYTGMLIVIVSNKTKKNRYEDMATHLYGRKMFIVTSIANLICLCSFVVSYIAFLKSMMPKELIGFWFKEKKVKPDWIADNFYG
jgi:amino acid permease